MPIMITNNCKVKFDSKQFRDVLEDKISNCTSKDRVEFILNCIESVVADFLEDAREEHEIE